MVMLEISCSFMVYINYQSCIQVFGTTVGESKQLSSSSDRNLGDNIKRSNQVLMDAC